METLDGKDILCYYSTLPNSGDNLNIKCISSSLGVNFDFFGIGEFWGCKSLRNDFGLQYRFFYYERASLIGGVALKAAVTYYVFRDDTFLLTV